MIIELENQDEPMTEEEMNALLLAIDMLDYNEYYDDAQILRDFISKIYTNAM